MSPMGIISHLQNIGSQLANGREEDAHEFLRYFLFLLIHVIWHYCCFVIHFKLMNHMTYFDRHVIDTMQSVCLMEAGVNALGSLEEDTTLMGQTFGGYLLSKVILCFYLVK